MWTEAIGAVAILGTLFNGYLIYRGSDRASERTADSQRDANATTGFVALTQEQRAEMDSLRTRTREAEDSARHAQESANAAERIAERCQMQQAEMMVNYRRLWAWAIQPCPHDTPPPRPPFAVLHEEENDG